MPTIDRPAPTRSSFACSGSFDFGTRNTPRTNAARMIGTLTRKTDPNQKWPSSQPLTTGPMTPAPPVTPAQMAIALARSSGPKTLTRIDSVDGMMNAAHAPIKARQPISCHISVDADASAALNRKPSNPSWSAPFRPNRSPMAPAVNSSPANTSEYAATTHCSCDVVASSSRDSVGMRDVEARVADEDDQQAEAQHGECPPTPRVELLGVGHGCRVWTSRSAGTRWQMSHCDTFGGATMGLVSGLRERKKEKTRDALVASALRQFTHRGFDRVTVEEIAASCDVSPRTFFRYFASKEDVLFAESDARCAQLVHALAEQGAEASSFQALEAAMRMLVSEYAEQHDVLRARHRIVTETPSLRTRATERQQGWETSIFDELRSSGRAQRPERLRSPSPRRRHGDRAAHCRRGVDCRRRLGGPRRTARPRLHAAPRRLGQPLVVNARPTDASGVRRPVPDRARRAFRPRSPSRS